MSDAIAHQETVTTNGIVARYSDMCCVAPSPALAERWNAELQKVRGRKGIAFTESMVMARMPRRLGFDDGYIIPATEYPLGTPLAAIRSAAADRAPLRGNVRVAVIVVDFSDKHVAATTSHFEDLFFSTGVLPHGSVKEYFTEVTNGLVTLTGAVVGPYRMPHTLAYYANNNFGIGQGPGDFRSPELAHDAAVAADPDINFGPYDNDGNGFVDAFIVVHAGEGGEVTGDPGDIWSHKATLDQPYVTDGTKIFGYLTIPEDAKIGVSAHELGHLLFGFPDLYDTDNTSEGVGNWCLMGGGSWNGGGDVPAHPSAWCKVNQGWAAVTNVTTSSTLSIPDVKSSRNVHRLWKDGGSGSEYFLIENRQRTGYDSDLPGDGLLIWHIDESQPTNTDENHYKVGLLQADGKRDLELAHNRGDAGDPYPGSADKTSATSSTTPNTKSFAGQNTCVSITSISPSAPTMSAKVAVTCGKQVVKDLSDKNPKELKEFKEGRKDLKDIKEGRKDFKEGKDVKERGKDLKDAKEGRKDFKDVKEVKEGKELKEGKETKDVKEEGKDLKELKEVKEGRKDGKDFGKDFKEDPEKGFERPPGGDPFGSPGQADLEARVAALEALLGGTAAEPFIGSDLRPDLIGAPLPQDPATDLTARMETGDAGAKRAFDTPYQ